jgi:DNA modification methylase
MGFSCFNLLLKNILYLVCSGKKERYGQKPVALMNYLVRRYTTGPGQIVMDPFMGTGSTGVAALQNKCPFIGMEIDRRAFFAAAHNIARVLVKFGDQFSV